MLAQDGATLLVARWRCVREAVHIHVMNADGEWTAEADAGRSSRKPACRSPARK